VDLSSTKARALIHAYAATGADHFRPRWPQNPEYSFDLNEAKKLLAKVVEEDSSGE
jgi:hypothetical protein